MPPRNSNIVVGEAIQVWVSAAVCEVAQATDAGWSSDSHLAVLDLLSSRVRVK
jgi:hypothetical protein